MRKLFPPVGAGFLAAAVTVFCYYHWQVRAAGNDILWGHDLAGYYNYLAQGLVSGHLYLPVEPSPQLLAQPNPWDPKVDDSLKLFDAVLYNRRYYLYHGIGPALMAFVPWRLITQHDLPENAAILGFGFGGWLFAAGTLVGLLRFQGSKLRAGPLFAALLALAACQAVPFLMNRVWVYEVAIAGGYFCISVALFCLVRFYRTGVRHWLVPSGIFFAIAVSCRPHLGLVGVLALLLILRKDRSGFFHAAIPFVVICGGVCFYNYLRFNDPFEFGTRYLLGGANQTEVHWKLSNLGRGFRYMLAEPPLVSPVFPWFHAAPRPVTVPISYTLEPLIGAFWLAPIVLLLPLALRRSPARPLLVLMATSGLGLLLFLAGTGWSVQRYQVDFLPLLLLVSLACGLSRLPLMISTVLILPGLAVSLALGITGPYDEMLHNRPARYVKIAGWFSPNANLRPQLNPPLRFEFALPPSRPEGTTDILVAAGPQANRYQLRLVQALGKPTLISEFGLFGASKATVELGPAVGSRHLFVRYDPADMTLRVVENSALVLVHKFGPLITAPAEITATGAIR